MPHLWGQVLIGGALGAWAGAIDHYLLFWALAALYAGVTQAPYTSLWLSPVILGSALVALAGAEPASAAVDLSGRPCCRSSSARCCRQTTARVATATRSTQALLHAVTALHEAGSETAAADVVAELAHTLLDPDVALVMVASAPGSGLFVNRGQRGVDRPRRRARGGHRSTGPASAWRCTRGPGHLRGRRADVAAAVALGRGPAGLRLGAVHPRSRRGRASSGCIVVGWNAPRTALDTFGQQVVSLLSHQAGALLERLRSVGRLEVQASTDALTGLANRRVFLESLDRLRPGAPWCSSTSTTSSASTTPSGHAAGDDVLVAFGRALRAACARATARPATAGRSSRSCCRRRRRST